MRNGIHFGLSLHLRDGGLETRDWDEPVVRTICISLALRIYRLPNHGYTIKRRKAFRHDSDHGGRHPAQLQRFSENVGILIEVGFPKRVADDDGLIVILHLGREKYPAQEWLCPKQAEKVGCDVLHRDMFRSPCARQHRFLIKAGESNILEHVILPFPVKRLCNGSPIHTLSRVRIPYCDELLRMIVRQGTIQQRIDYAEDGAVCPDSQSERKRYDGEEPRALVKATNGQAKILRHARYIRQRLAHRRTSRVSIASSKPTLRSRVWVSGRLTRFSGRDTHQRYDRC